MLIRIKNWKWLYFIKNYLSIKLFDTIIYFIFKILYRLVYKDIISSFCVIHTPTASYKYFNVDEIPLNIENFDISPKDIEVIYEFKTKKYFS